MPSWPDHENLCLEVLGNRYKWVHEEMDKPFRWLGNQHRILYHDMETAVWLYEQIGDRSLYWAVKLHILQDLRETFRFGWQRELVEEEFERTLKVHSIDASFHGCHVSLPTPYAVDDDFMELEQRIIERRSLRLSKRFLLSLLEKCDKHKAPPKRVENDLFRLASFGEAITRFHDEKYYLTVKREGAFLRNSSNTAILEYEYDNEPNDETINMAVRNIASYLASSRIGTKRGMISIRDIVGTDRVTEAFKRYYSSENMFTVPPILFNLARCDSKLVRIDVEGSTIRFSQEFRPPTLHREWKINIGDLIGEGLLPYVDGHERLLPKYEKANVSVPVPELRGLNILSIAGRASIGIKGEEKPLYGLTDLQTGKAKFLISPARLED